MGKTKRWFKRLVARIRSDPDPKVKPSLLKPYSENAAAIAIAAASAVAAEVAFAASQAAAVVVRLTSTGRETAAALFIQSHFRGYLARRALRALKGLVKLQALVRGHITRRRTAETIRSIEAMLRAQARARSMRAQDSPISSEKSFHIYHPGPPTPEKMEMSSYSRITSNTQSPTLSRGSVSRSINRVIIHPDNHAYLSSPGWSDSQIDTSKRTPSKKLIQDEEDGVVFCTSENSPQFYSVSSRVGSRSRRMSPMTPTKSDTSTASCPSYMAYTKSSRAKMRSSSAPRQRPLQCGEREGSIKRSGFQQETALLAATSACFANKAYVGSGRLDRNNAEVCYSL